MIKTGQYISEWELGKISTTAVIDTDTYKVTAKQVKSPDLGGIVKEYFESENKIYNICMNCHRCILINNRCPDDNCESNQ